MEEGGGGSVMDIFYFLELYNTILAEVKNINIIGSNRDGAVLRVLASHKRGLG